MSGVFLDQPPTLYKLRQDFSELLASLAFFHRPPVPPGVYMAVEDSGTRAWLLLAEPFPGPIMLMFTCAVLLY